MKILIRASSGEYGNVGLAVVDVDVAHILDLWAHWPAIPGLTGMEFDDGGDWYEYNDDVGDFEGAIVAESAPDLGEVVRVELERLVVRRDYCFWRGHTKYGDHTCETDCLHAQDLKALTPVMDQLKEAIDKNGSGD